MDNLRVCSCVGFNRRVADSCGGFGKKCCRFLQKVLHLFPLSVSVHFHHRAGQEQEDVAVLRVAAEGHLPGILERVGEVPEVFARGGVGKTQRILGNLVFAHVVPNDHAVLPLVGIWA